MQKISIHFSLLYICILNLCFKITSHNYFYLLRVYVENNIIIIIIINKLIYIRMKFSNL